MKLSHHPRLAAAFKIIAGLAALYIIVWLAAHLFTGSSQIARAIAWGDSDVQDYRRFPARVVRSAPPIFTFKTPTAEQAARYTPLFEGVEFISNGKTISRDWDDFMKWTDTTAFLVIKDDMLLYEGYFNGYTHDSTVTVFSVSKSFASALVGIAIDEGYIASLEDPITKYVPELLEKDARYDQIKLRHLVSMSSGIHYVEHGLPWSDDADTYYSPDLRRVAVSSTIDGPPGVEFLYNNYHPLLIGMVLERTTGRSVSQYLEEKIWSQIGAEADASWSLDSQKSGFEKMESGVNGRAIDFAKFGRLFLQKGNWEGKQLISEAWVEASTKRDTTTDPADFYQYFWWVDTLDLAHNHYLAAGKHGQYIYIIPEQKAIIVRFGRTDPTRVWREFFDYFAKRMAALST